MITPSEREWLRNRKGKDDLYLFCKHCMVRPKTDDCYWNHVVGACPVYPDIEEANEFEAKVAAKLATEHENIMLNGGVCEACFAWETCFNGFEENDNALCSFEMLKAARLIVEEEMECTA